MRNATSSILAGERVVWVFYSSDARAVHPCGVWSTRECADAWIRRVDARGILSAYILDESAYDSNVRLGLLRLTKPERETLEFQRRYNTAVDHDHYNGPHAPTHPRLSAADDGVATTRQDRTPARQSRVEPRTGTVHFQCVCCGSFTLSDVGLCGVCTECGWEDWHECNEAPDEIISPNCVSLNDARSVFLRFGAGACCEVNFSSLDATEKIKEIESMPLAVRASLRTARQRTEGATSQK